MVAADEHRESFVVVSGLERVPVGVEDVVVGNAVLAGALGDDDLHIHKLPCYRPDGKVTCGLLAKQVIIDTPHADGGPNVPRPGMPHKLPAVGVRDRPTMAQPGARRVGACDRLHAVMRSPAVKDRPVSRRPRGRLHKCTDGSRVALPRLVRSCRSRGESPEGQKLSTSPYDAPSAIWAT